MPEYDIVHFVPHKICLGGDPMEYWYDHIRQFNIIVNLTADAGHGTVPHAVVMHFSMLDIEEDEQVPDRERMEAFLGAVDTFACAGSSLWHCAAGINRSAFFLAAYLHLYRDMTIEEAIELLRERRDSMVLNNRVFHDTLIKWYSK